VNLSEGTHDGQGGEVDDARAGLDFLRERYPDLPYSIAGFSFGSRIALRLGCTLDEPRPQRIIAVGFPTTIGSFDYLESCRLPKFFVHSTNDVFGPKLELEKEFEKFSDPKFLHFIQAEDHFFAGALDELENTIANVSPAGFSEPRR
jgi:alpha/beta superfamily hydrolase